MAYTKFQTDWMDGSGGGTPVTGDAMDHIENGIVATSTVADSAQTDATTGIANAATAQADATQALSDAAAAQATGTAAVPKATVTAKGDLLVATAAATVTRLGVGTDDRILTADAAEPSGVKWGRKITIAATAPASPVTGDLWLKPVV